MAEKIIDFSGIKVDNVTLPEAVEQVFSFIAAGRPCLIVTPNPEIIVACQQDQELKMIINSADLRVPDGISMVVVSRILKRPLKERVSGIDLMLALVKEAAATGKKIFLLGSGPGVAKQAANNLIAQYPSLLIAGTHDGYTNNNTGIIAQIQTSKPDLLFVGLGAGRQERWLSQHLKELNVPAAMVIGGSLDVISGVKKRAPTWTQKLYVEWLYRLLTEPQRWKRQLALPKFLWLMFFSHRK